MGAAVHTDHPRTREVEAEEPKLKVILSHTAILRRLELLKAL